LNAVKILYICRSLSCCWKY